MPQFAPLSAFRYAQGHLVDLIAPPYDVINDPLRAELGARSPHNIVHLDLPQGDGDKKYANAAALLTTWIQQGVLEKDDAPLLLTYEQSFNSPETGDMVTRRGFFALVRADAYEHRQVLPHERTLSGPKVDRYKLFSATRAALSPVFLLYTDKSGQAHTMLRDDTEWQSFTTDDGMRHRVGEIRNEEAISQIFEALSSHPLLIADGHHRYETAVSYGSDIDASTKGAAPNGAHRFVLAYLSDADDEGLLVFPTHRLVHSLPAFSYDAMRKSLSEFFTFRSSTLEAVQQDLATLGERRPSFAFVQPDGTTEIASIKEFDLNSHPTLASLPDVIRRTDVGILHTAVFEHSLGITPEMQSQKTNLRYFKQRSDALDAIKMSGDLLVLMNGTPMSQVRDACLAGEVMPQKSTYFYPKVPTGLAIHIMDPETPVR